MHLITCRTAQAELLLVPSSELNEILGGVLARYAEAYDITLYAYIFLGNHYHLLVQGPEGALPRFAENLNREIAKRVNRLLTRKGFFWGRRYDDDITIEETDALEGLLYIVTNPVKHGMVTQPRHWPGLSSYWQIVKNIELTFTFTHYTKYHVALRRSRVTGELVRRDDFQTIHTLRLAPLPIYRHLSSQERSSIIRNKIEKRSSLLSRQRKKDGLGFIGRKAILAQRRRGTFPREPAQSPRARGYTKSPLAKGLYLEEERIRRQRYTKASVKFRRGNYFVLFPVFTLKPPLHHVPP